MKAKEVVEKYIDKDGKEFVVLTDKNGISEVKYVRDLIIETFGNADKYDKLMQEKKEKNNE